MTPLRQFVCDHKTRRMRSFRTSRNLPNSIIDAMLMAFHEIQEPNFNLDDASSMVLLTDWVNDFLHIATTPGIDQFLSQEALSLIDDLQDGTLLPRKLPTHR